MRGGNPEPVQDQTFASFSTQLCDSCSQLCLDTPNTMCQALRPAGISPSQIVVPNWLQSLTFHPALGREKGTVDAFGN